MTEIKLVPRNEVDKQYTWDMTLLYKTDEDYKNTLEQTKKEIIEFKDKYEGKLADYTTLNEAILKYEEIEEECYKLLHYAELPMSVDRFNDNVVANATIFEELSSLSASKLSFFSTELISLDEGFINTFVADYRPDLKYYFEKLVNMKKHVLPKEVEEIIASYESLPDFYNLYEVTKHEDMQFDSFEANGKTYENSFVLYENLHEMDNDTDIRRAAAKSFYKTLNAYKNTSANEYISHIKREKMLATARGYDSVIDYLLDKQDDSRELYDRQIQTLMTDLAPHIRRYIKLLAREHKIEDMQFADCKINLDPDFEIDMTIEESREYLKKALGVLGEDYIKMIDESYDKRWTDFPQNIGKSTGGFCATVPNVAGFILLSWTGKMNEVFARFKRWVISNMISRTYFHNMVTHYLEAVYQDRIYKKVDNNEMLTAEVLSTIKREIMEEFFGDSLVINEGAELTWMRQPHYYMGLYPYTYSAGLTIGTAVANKIDKNPSYADTWLNVLSKGSSMSALDLSKLAGCDVSTTEPLKEAISYVGYLVDQLYELTDELKK